MPRMTFEEEQQVRKSDSAEVAACYEEVQELREAVKELAAAVNYPTTGNQELLYRLRVRGIETGIPFSTGGDSFGHEWVH